MGRETRLFYRVSFLLAKILFGYVVAVVASTLTVVIVHALPTILPDKGRFGSFYMFFRDAPSFVYDGLFYTAAFAWPGYLITISAVLSGRLKLGRSGFGIAGMITAVQAVLVLGVYMGMVSKSGFSHGIRDVIAFFAFRLMWLNVLVGGYAGGLAYATLRQVPGHGIMMRESKSDPLSWKTLLQIETPTELPSLSSWVRLSGWLLICFAAASVLGTIVTVTINTMINEHRGFYSFVGYFRSVFAMIYPITYWTAIPSLLAISYLEWQRATAIWNYTGCGLIVSLAALFLAHGSSLAHFRIDPLIGVLAGGLMGGTVFGWLRLKKQRGTI